jgi:predicted TIM-barrel fold metal-dependent hydrolase
VGSDWPFVDLAGGPGYWRNAWVTLLEGLSPHDPDAILGGTSVDFYGLSGLAKFTEITLM